MIIEIIFVIICIGITSYLYFWFIDYVDSCKYYMFCNIHNKLSTEDSANCILCNCTCNECSCEANNIHFSKKNIL